MAFNVVVSDLALLDIDNAVTYIANDSTDAAEKWLAGLERLIMSLKNMPSRFPFVPESAELQHEYHSAIYFSHRVIFRIDEKASLVYVARVHHGAKRALRNSDLVPRYN